MRARTIRLILLPVFVVALLVVGTAQAGSGGSFDHLKCFRIRDSLTNRRTVLLADLLPSLPFAPAPDCRVTLPARHFCVPAAKGNVLSGDVPVETFPVPPGPLPDDFLCYDLHCERDRPDLTVLDQFGARPVRIRHSDFLCMPARKVPQGSPTPTPGATSTPLPPSPTPTATPVPCQLITGIGERPLGGTCGGDCPPDQTCLFDSDQTSCACVPLSAACAPLPPATSNQYEMCGGLCPRTDELCLPGATDTPAGGRGIDCSCQGPL
jgi:hypothetical protein